MARWLDLVLCIFPFEADLYKESGLRAVFVGHPMIERLQAQKLSVARDQRAVNGRICVAIVEPADEGRAHATSTPAGTAVTTGYCPAAASSNRTVGAMRGVQTAPLADVISRTRTRRPLSLLSSQVTMTAVRVSAICGCAPPVPVAAGSSSRMRGAKVRP